ncbi:MAG: glycosyltransferase family 39 protein [Bacteroidia bacterium]|nr:glycosyltransferase family 39 protein [Bacteroidia bacterium]
MNFKNPYLIISILSVIIFVPFLGNVHLFDWDEINFAEAAREMILTENYRHVTINFEPFWEKPPLFLWFQVICMKIFGINEFAARLPNAVCGILTLNLIYYWGKKFFNSKLALFWVLLYAGSFTPHFYFKTGIIDPWYNLFIFISVVQLYFVSQSLKMKNLRFFVCGIFLGLAVLTKGPVAIVIIGFCSLIFLIINNFKFYFSLKNLIVLVLSIVIVPIFWFLPDWINGDFWFTIEFLKYQADLFLNPVASHGQPWYYHPVVLLIGCFPAIVISIPYLISKKGEDRFLLWMQILFWVTLILFSTVTTKIVHYSSLCYLPATFIAAYFLFTKNIIYKWQNVMIILIGLLYFVFFTIVVLTGNSNYFKTLISQLTEDKFAIENIFVNTNWSFTDFVLPILFLVIILIYLIYVFRKKTIEGIKFLLISTVLFYTLLQIVVVPKVENHIQGTLINFYKTLKEKNIYIETEGFKSYAHYFYTLKQKPKESDMLEKAIKAYCEERNYKPNLKLKDSERDALNGFKKEWLINSNADKPVYLVYKVNDNLKQINENPNFKKIFNKGGFVVYLK